MDWDYENRMDIYDKIKTGNMFSRSIIFVIFSYLMLRNPFHD